MKFSITALFFIVCFNLQGQKLMTGKVYSGDDQPVIGATIQIQDTRNATITNAQGEFELNAGADEEVVIIISSIGFQTQKISLDKSEENSTLRIKMIEDVIDLPEIVIESVTMTGGLSNLKRSVGSAHFIGQKEIQKFSYTDINRTLRNIPGVNVQEEDGYGLRPNIGLRATGSERSSKITVMEDGILAAPAPYSAPSAYYFPTIGRMEAIEIMKGSSQIKYGPFTTGGAINLISTPIPLSFSGHADFIAGSDGYRMIHANLGNSHKNFGYMVETLQYGADGFKQLDGGGNTGFNKEDYLAKFKVNTNPDAAIYQSLQFKIGQAEEVSNETYLGLTEEDFEQSPFRRYAGSQKDVMTTTHRQYLLTHHIQATSFLDIVTSAYRNEFSRNWYKLDKVNGASISNILSDPDIYSDELSVIRGESNQENSLTVKANNRSYYSRGIQTNFILHFADGGLSHKIDIGIRRHQDQIDRFQWVDSYDMENQIMKLNTPGERGTESNRVETANATAAYLQYRLKWQNLTITPGIRYENVTIFREDFGKEDPTRNGVNLASRENTTSIFIPGIGFNYKWTSSWNIFGGLHKGFAPPGSKEGTKAEESWNYEFGGRYEREGVRMQVIGYYNDYANLLGSDLAATGGTGSTDLFNGGEAIAKGIELEASYDLLYGRSRSFNMPLGMTYTYTHATFSDSFESDFEAWGDVESGASLPYVPKHQFSISMGLEHAKFLFDFSGRYNGDMLAQAGYRTDESIDRTEAYFTVDLSLNYRLTPIISAFANVNNVGNTVYVASLRPAGLRPGLSRTYNFGLKANF